MYFNYLDKNDPEIAGMIKREMSRQETKVEMIASENFTSAAVLEAVGSALTNKYAEGYPGHRYYGGCEHIDEVEALAIERAKEVFGAEYVNVQPHSGANANTAVYVGLLKPGDKIMGMSLAEGGHLSHGSKANVSGKYYDVIPYGISADTETIDYDEVEAIALKEKPKMIVSGASAYPRFLDFERFRYIADKVGAILMVDMAHIAGLVAAKLHPNPFGFAQVVTSTTHKTLRGPRGGIIFCDEEYGAKIDKGVFPGTQGGPLEHVIAGKAVCFKEALDPGFKDYQKQIIKNAAVLAEELMKADIRLVSGGTDNHLVLLNLVDKPYSGKDAEDMLDAANITTNKNAVVGDPRGPQVTSGVRLGTPALTTRGFKEDETRKVAEAIVLVLNNPGSDEHTAKAKAIIDELTGEYPLYEKIMQK